MAITVRDNEKMNPLPFRESNSNDTYSINKDSDLLHSINKHLNNSVAVEVTT
jgi:hypothetical protein